MPHDIDPDALVNIPCPSCSHKEPVSVATLQASPRMVCESCGANFTVNAEKVMDRIRAAQEQAELDRRRRGL